jgi:hypothetical protein
VDHSSVAFEELGHGVSIGRARAHDQLPVARLAGRADLSSGRTERRGTHDGQSFDGFVPIGRHMGRDH